MLALNTVPSKFLLHHWNADCTKKFCPEVFELIKKGLALKIWDLIVFTWIACFSKTDHLSKSFLLLYTSRSIDSLVFCDCETQIRLKRGKEKQQTLNVCLFVWGVRCLHWNRLVLSLQMMKPERKKEKNIDEQSKESEFVGHKKRTFTGWRWIIGRWL